jgi:hypothetical protein
VRNTSSLRCERYRSRKIGLENRGQAQNGTNSRSAPANERDLGAVVGLDNSRRNDRLPEGRLGLPPALRCESGREPAERATAVDNDRGSQVIGGGASALGCERRGWPGEDFRGWLRYDCRRREMTLRCSPVPESELDPEAGVDPPRTDDHWGSESTVERPRAPGLGEVGIRPVEGLRLTQNGRRTQRPARTTAVVLVGRRRSAEVDAWSMPGNSRTYDYGLTEIGVTSTEVCPHVAGHYARPAR